MVKMILIALIIGPMAVFAPFIIEKILELLDNLEE